MTVLVLSVLLTVTVIGSGLAAGPLVRRAAPALMRRPRLAVVGLLGMLAVWLTGFAAIGPMLAWGLSGPSRFMPGSTGVVCQRCLDAANPLPPGMEINTAIPVIVLLGLPVVLAVVMLVSGLRYFVRSTRQSAQLQAALSMGAEQLRIAGHLVTVIPSERPTAFAMSNRRWGIVVSSGLLQLLGDEELSAVLEHEAAHLRQRHHAILAILDGAMAPLRWIPLVAAVTNGVPHYLEMAADNAATSHTSISTLAGALLKIGEKSDLAVDSPTWGSVALHAAGLDRIRHLVQPPVGTKGVVPVATMLALGGLLLISSVAVQFPYLKAVLDGCLIA